MTEQSQIDLYQNTRIEPNIAAGMPAVGPSDPETNSSAPIENDEIEANPEFEDPLAASLATREESSVADPDETANSNPNVPRGTSLSATESRS